MLYLKMKMQRNGYLTNHIRKRMKRANVVMKHVWESEKESSKMTSKEG